MKIVRIYVTDKNREAVLAGTVQLLAGQLIVKPTMGYENIMKMVRETPIFVERQITPDEPAAFFDGLPMQYRGSYMWAEMKEM